MSENKSLGLATVLDQIKAVRKQLDDVESRVDGAAAALEYYGPRLGEAQSKSLEALSDAEFARRAARSSQAQRDAAASEYYGTNDPVQREAAKDQYNRDNARVTAANQDLAVAKEKLRQAIELRDTAATSATNALQSIDQSSPLRDTTWDRITEFVNRLIDLWDKYVAPHLDTICKILDVLSFVLTVVAVILTLTGVGAPVGGALLACLKIATVALKVITVVTTVISATKLAVSGLKTMTGRQTPGEFIKDAAVFGVAFVLKKVSQAGIVKGIGKKFSNSTLKLDRLEGVVKATSDSARYVEERVRESVKDLARDALGHGTPKIGPTGSSRLDTYRLQTCGATA